MTTPTRMRTRRSRRPDNSPVANEDREAKALATADAIAQRVNSLVRHLASLDEQQLRTVAEPILETLTAAVASIDQLHTLFAGWATEHPDHTAPSRDTGHRGSTAAAPDVPSADAQPAADGSDQTLHIEHPPTANLATPPQPQPAYTTEPAGPTTSSVPAIPGDQRPATVTTAQIGQPPAAGAYNSSEPAHQQPPQQTPLDTVADLAHRLTAVSPDTPIRLHHDDTTYLLRIHHTGGRLVLTIAQPDS